MKSICLINPPSPWLISDRVMIPIGLLTVASECREIGFKVSFVDLSGGAEWEFPEADYYGISFVTPQVEIVKEIMKKLYGKIIIAGGIHATALPREVFAMGFHAVVAGDARKAMQDIFERGIGYNFKTPNWSPFYKLSHSEAHTWPAYDLIDMESYISNTGVTEYLGKGKREINIMASRGCSHHCAYCTNFKGPVRQRSVEDVLDGVRLLEYKYHVNQIHFIDDNLLINREWLYALCDGMKNLGISWHCLGRADQLDHDKVVRMVLSGCTGIDFGIETASNRLLKVIKKGTKIAKMHQGIIHAWEAGLKIRCQMMVGLPSEREEDIEMSRKFIESNNEMVAKWGIHIFIPFPSCDIYQNNADYDYEITNRDFSTYQTIGKPGEWEYIHDNAVYKTRLNTLLEAAGNKNIYVND